MSYCKFRVWDNGDTDSCGQPSHREGSQYCAAHWEHRKKQAAVAVQSAEVALHALRLLLEDLGRA